MKLFSLMISTSLFILTCSATAQTSEQKGLAIAKQMKARDIGWGNSQSDMYMTLRTRKGQEIVRQMRSKSLEVDGDGDKALTIFDTPLDVKGTAFLSFSHSTGNDDQWIYLPAIKRVKRISSRNRSGPFLGSEFSFEDLSSFEVEKFNFNYLGDDQLNGQAMVKISMDPVDPHSGYSRADAWVDTDQYRVQKIDFYDRRSTLLKTLTISDYKLYKGKYWRADKQSMINHKTGKSTDMLIKNLKFDVGLSDSDFNQNRLKRAR
ncbi:MAG: outer membrane lipoprotein-sorting protein [Arenicella sp.]|jgi:outer membrane lipoprotein-sorting protein